MEWILIGGIACIVFAMTERQPCGCGFWLACDDCSRRLDEVDRELDEKR